MSPGTGAIGEHVLSLVLDYLAIGVDPARSVIFAHSAVPELNQLLLPFLSLVTEGELRRNPTVKDEIAHSRQASVSGLMLTYPVHQAADILAVKGNLVPVGQDQLPHVEVTRLVARRFNERYPGAGGAGVFPEPDALLSDAPLLLGTDGGKMSKSRGNAIALRATADETARLIKGAKTDGLRHISYDPAARPEVSSLVLLAALCLDRDPVAVAAEIGDGGAALLKRVVTDAVNERFAPVRARRAELAADPGYARQVLRDGCVRAARSPRPPWRKSAARWGCATRRARFGRGFGAPARLSSGSWLISPGEGFRGEARAVTEGDGNAYSLDDQDRHGGRHDHADRGRGRGRRARERRPGRGACHQVARGRLRSRPLGNDSPPIATRPGTARRRITSCRAERRA